MQKVFTLDSVITGNDEVNEGSVFVLTNTDGFLGAFEHIEDHATMRKICDDMGWISAMVLPSSKHELLMMRSDKMTKEEADALVQSVNAREVEECDQLSDHAFMYDRVTDTLTL